MIFSVATLPVFIQCLIFGEQMVLFDLRINLLRFLDPILRAFHPPVFESLHCPGDSLGQTFQNTGFVRIADRRFLLSNSKLLL